MIDSIAKRSNSLYVLKFEPHELTIINVFAPSEYDEDDHAGDTWANVLCTRAANAAIAENLDGDVYAPDYDKTTCGDTRGINVLILASTGGRSRLLITGTRTKTAGEFITNALFTATTAGARPGAAS